MSPFNAEASLITGGFTIAGVLIGGFVGYYFSSSLAKKQDFNKAAAEFRASFVEEQRLLDPNSFADRASAGSASSILKKAIHDHERAMIRFEPFVSKGDTEAYKKAWQQYAGNSQHFEQYTGDTAIKKEEGRKLALDLINNLLKFAKHK